MSLLQWTKLSEKHMCSASFGGGKGPSRRVGRGLTLFECKRVGCRNGLQDVCRTRPYIYDLYGKWNGNIHSRSRRIQFKRYQMTSCFLIFRAIKVLSQLSLCCCCFIAVDSYSFVLFILCQSYMTKHDMIRPASYGDRIMALVPPESESCSHLFPQEPYVHNAAACNRRTYVQFTPLKTAGID